MRFVLGLAKKHFPFLMEIPHLAAAARSSRNFAQAEKSCPGHACTVETGQENMGDLVASLLLQRIVGKMPGYVFKKAMTTKEHLSV